MWSVGVHLARMRNGSVDLDRRAFNRKQRIVVSVLLLGVNMGFAQPLEILS